MPNSLRGARDANSNFKENVEYHKLRKGIASDTRYGAIRYLDPGNPRSATKPFFNPNILQVLDEYYERMPPS